jgi:WD40 repeat protein
MTEHTEGFPPEMLDEQLEHPLENLSPAEVRLVDELYKNYRDTWERSAAVLDHAWERVMQNQRTHPAQTRTRRHIPAFAQRDKQLERLSSMPKKQKSRLTVLFSTLAAILLVALVMGGLALVRQAHTQTGSPRATSNVTPSPTPAPAFGKTVYTAPGNYWVGISWSPDSKRIASLNNGELQIWDATTGGNRLHVTVPTDTNRIAWSPNSQLIAVNTGQEILFVNGQTGAIGAHFAPPAGGVSIIGTSSPYLSATFPASGDSPLGDLAWSPDGRFLATDEANPATGAQQLLILNVQSNQVAYTLPIPGENLDDFAFSPDSQYLAASLASQTVPTSANAYLTQVWKIATKQVIFKQPGGGDLAWQPASHNLVYARFSSLKEGGSSANLELWNVLTNQELNHYTTNAFGEVVWSPDGRYLAYAYAGTVTTNAIVILNPSSGQQVYAYKGPNQSGAGFLDLAWSPNGKYIVSVQEYNNFAAQPTSTAKVKITSNKGGVITTTIGNASDSNVVEVWTAI